VAAALAVSLPVVAPAAAQDSPPPLEYFAIREVIQQVEVSPNGEKMALLRNDSKDGNPIIEIYDTSDLTKTPERIGSDPMELTSLFWANDNFLVFNARQKIRNRIEGFNDGVYRSSAASYNLRTKKFQEFDSNTSIANLLAFEPNKVILGRPRSNATLGEDDPFAFARPNAYYEVDLERGTQKLLIKGSDRYGQVQFDDNGNPRSTGGYDAARQEFVFYYRKPGETSWSEIYRRSGYSFEDFSYVGDVEGNPSLIYVIAHNGDDKRGLWTFNTDTKQFVDLVYRHDFADVVNVRRHSNYWGEGSEITGVLRYGEKFITEWFDEEEAALFAQLEDVIPNAHQISISSRSRDGNVFTVFNSGPKDPGTTYLVNNGQLQKIGSLNPLLTPDMLSPVRYIKYPARDGRTIPAYVIEPEGEGPHPLIVLPHGGPHVAEVINYDEWGQLLASRGYMVLYPQYRGSLGYGLDHFLATWNEHGKKMQDDKDDGALYLVQQGKVDPDRIAMFGWSYGGYAALVAVSRTPQIYQCSVAGAPVADPTMQFNYYKARLQDFDREFEDQRRSGISPVEEVDKINIPLLFIHPRVDQRVPYEHFQVYKRAVERAGKADMVEFVTLEGADHFSNTLFFEHQLKLYEELTSFLANDCGPGGL
jgi:dipeptidyl aminopeptidase/acylaminoacyl peptidase